MTYHHRTRCTYFGRTGDDSTDIYPTQERKVIHADFTPTKEYRGYTIVQEGLSHYHIYDEDGFIGTALSLGEAVHRIDEMEGPEAA